MCLCSVFVGHMMEFFAHSIFLIDWLQTFLCTIWKYLPSLFSSPFFLLQLSIFRQELNFWPPLLFSLLAVEEMSVFEEKSSWGDGGLLLRLNYWWQAEWGVCVPARRVQFVFTLLKVLLLYDRPLFWFVFWHSLTSNLQSFFFRVSQMLELQACTIMPGLMFFCFETRSGCITLASFEHIGSSNPSFLILLSRQICITMFSFCVFSKKIPWW